MRDKAPYYEGNKYYNRGRYEEAIKYYDLTLKENPRHNNALIAKGDALYNLDKYDLSLECYEAVLNESPTVPTEIQLDALVGKGNVHYALNQYNEAIDCFIKVLNINPNQTSALIGVGYLLYMKYEYENAIQYFDEAINRHRKSIMALIGKAFCLFDLKKYEESDKYYDMVLVIDPNHASALVGKGKIFYEKRDLNKAIEYFTKASNSDPKFMVPLLNKIYVFQELGEHDRANACYNNIRKSDKKFYLLSKIVDGIELCENDRFEDAIDIYSEIVQKDPNLISAWINMGLIYYLLGIYEKSNACCNRAIAIDPKSTMALYCKRVIYYKQNEFNKSNEYYQRVLEIDPNFFSLNWISDTVYVKHNKAVEYFTFFGTYNKNIIIKIINSTASSDAQLLRLQQSDDRDQHSISDSNLDTIEESLLKFAGQRIDQRVYFEKNICNMDLEFKIGNLGEKYVNNYLTQLERNGSIKRFCWVSDQHATSPFDFYVINDNLDVILIDIKSTNNHFNNKFYLSSNELEQIASSEYEYRIYRIYEMSDSTAKLRISEDIRDFIKSVFELLNRLPEGVRPENISISPSVLTFQSEIIIERGW